LVESMKAISSTSISTAMLSTSTMAIFGPFQGPSSSHLLRRWSLIDIESNALDAEHNGVYNYGIKELQGNGRQKTSKQKTKPI
jgi:hypothetical protein